MNDDRNPNDLSQLIGKLTNNGGPKAQQSPTLKSTNAAGRQSLSTICQDCPHAMWFATPQHRKAYCRVMHSVTYSDEHPSPRDQITACDGLLLEK